MKRTILVLTLLSIPIGASAQETIEGALAAAPGRAREDAAVIKWNGDFTYETLKEGTNRWVCYHRSGDPGRQPYAVQCTSVANLDRVAQNRRFAAEAEDRQALNAMVAAAEADGTREAVEYGSMWIAANGPDQASAGRHITVAVPGATTESTGFPDSREAGGVYLMAAGTGAAHLMVPWTGP